MTTTATTLLDLREIAPRERHALIFDCFDALSPGQSLEVANDHDPRPLRDQFQARSAGQFDWIDLESGPAQWRVRIGKLAAGRTRPAGDSCCSGGACCG